MIFHPTRIVGAFLLELEPVVDERGFFARTWCQETFRRQGLADGMVQCSLSHNRSRGTLRGLHFQRPPFAEAKIVRCIRGRIFDVIVDMRPRSASYRQWQSFEMGAAERTALYIPEGVAHGFQTLEDDTEIFYQMSAPYEASSAMTVRWNDPDLSIPWPITNPILSEKDR